MQWQLTVLPRGTWGAGAGQEWWEYGAQDRRGGPGGWVMVLTAHVYRSLHVFEIVHDKTFFK